MSFSPKKILFVVNSDWFFISHRLVLAEKAKEKGYECYVACPNTGRKNEIEDKGIKFIDLPFERSGTNPIKELKVLNVFFNLYRKIKPDIVHQITMKPVVYGSIVAKVLQIPVVNAISGMGYAFENSERKILQFIIKKLMQWGFNRGKLVSIFQNKDDFEEMKSHKIISSKNEIVFVKGSGVDLQQFSYSPLSKEDRKLIFLLPARLLWAKGIREFKEASGILFDKYKNKILFQLMGKIDPGNPASISEKELKGWNEDNYFEWIPYQKKVVPYFKNADVIVLPSFYREGMPKSLLEACAIGRPIITTNAIGCKECVDEGINGLKVVPKSSIALAEAIEKLILSKELREQMGRNSRMKAEKEFDVQFVIKKHIEIYKGLLEIKDKD